MESVQQRYHHHELCHRIDKYKYEHFQIHKLSGKVCGPLPEREMKILHWEEVAIDLIGPWNVKVNGCMV